MLSKDLWTQRGHRGLALACAALLLTTITGCDAVNKLTELTEPDVPSVDRTLTLSVSASNVPEGGGEIELVARVSADGVAEAGTPVTFETTAGEFLDGNVATTDASGEARRILNVSEPALVSAKITAGPVTVAASNEIEIQVGGPGAVQFQLEMSPSPAETGNPAKFDISATHEDGSWAKGPLTVEFGDGRSERLPEFNGQTRVEHVYREASVFNVRLLIDADGTEVARSFQIRVKDGARTVVELIAARPEVNAREPLGFTVRPRTDTGRVSTGKVRVDWGDGRSTNLGELSDTARIDHTYRDPGSYKVVAELTDSSGKQSRASVRIRVLDPVSISGSLSASDRSPIVKDEVSFTFTATRSDGRASSGTVAVSFGDGDSTTQSVSNSRATFDHEYTEEGSFTVRAEFDDGEGHSTSASLAITVQAAGSGGGGGGGGGTGGGGSQNDEISSSSITFWREPNMGNWAVTSDLYDASGTNGRQVLRHTRAGQWPAADLFQGDHAGPNQPLEGNAWIVVQFSDGWHATPFEWLISGETVKIVPNDQFPDHTKLSKFAGWQPKPGEVVGLFVSSRAWVGQTNVKERSQIRLVTWQ